MARPATLQFLKHGKALCRAVFGGFVETWNYAIARADNLRGDADVNPSEGCIHVDNANPECPVIRLDKSKLPQSGGSGGGVAQITLIGNDATPGTSVTCTTGQITFASASNSNVIVTPSVDSSGNATLTIGVYYV